MGKRVVCDGNFTEGYRNPGAGYATYANRSETPIVQRRKILRLYIIKKNNPGYGSEVAVETQDFASQIDRNNKGVQKRKIVQRRKILRLKLYR